MPTAEKEVIDLTQCDRELIQYNRAIQPHGVLLTLSGWGDETTLRIMAASANTHELIGKPVADLLNHPLTAAFPPAQALWILKRSQELATGPVPSHLGSVSVEARSFELFAHRIDNKLILELEQVSAEKASMAGLYSAVRSCIAELQPTRDVERTLGVAVRHIRRLTGYDRVLAYKFLADGTGHILAEDKRDELSSFIGLHFPPGDVPAPARRVLSLVWVRYQPDIAYIPVPIEASSLDDPTLDLSYSILRSTSAMCNRYYLNLGVRSKLVIALISDGELWGAITCQHKTAREVPYEVRMACETIAHTVSISLVDKERSGRAREAMQVRQNVDDLIDKVSGNHSWAASLAGGLLGCIPASGRAAVIEGSIVTQGSTPAESELAELVKWLDSHDMESRKGVFSTNCLPARFPPAARYATVASGILAIQLGDSEYCLWFRPQIPYEVTWAGDPSKPVEVDEHDGRLRLAPRTKFEMQRSMLKGLSEPWNADEVEAASQLRRAVLTIRRGEYLTRSVHELKTMNAGLESFAYTAAHDLREPLRNIGTSAQLLALTLPENTSDQDRARLATIPRLTLRMDELLQSLLHCSRIDRIAPERHKTNVSRVIANAVESLSETLDKVDAKIKIHGKLPDVECDPVQTEQVFTNLIMNGLKYNDSAEKLIEIGYTETPEPAFYVKDNGIGIAKQHQEAVFTIFRRLHQREAYGGGMGAGLAIVKKIIDRHNGKIWIESSPGAGATFFFTLGPAKHMSAGSTG